MKSLKDFNFKNKKVLVRCDFQVPLSEQGEILDDFRIRQTIPTIEYLIKEGAKVILISHWKPEGKAEPRSLKPISLRTEELLRQKINFLDDCIGKKVRQEIEKMTPGQISFLENLRAHREEEDYYPPTALLAHPPSPKKESENFAKELAKLGDIYINDAFGVCHRVHASIVGVPKYLPSGAGFLLEREIKVLSNVLENPWRPLVTIIGGVKISTKIQVIEQFLKIADQLLLGGEVANTVLAGKGILVGRPLPEEKVMEKIEKIDLTNQKLHLPVDGAIALKDRGEDFLREGAIGTCKKDEGVFDIGSETRKIFKRIIKEAKMIVWSGPLGLFEDKRFEKGTKEIAEEMVRNYTAFKIVGGGETIEAIAKFGLLGKFDHVSTGGGAMLEFLAGEKLPGIEVLRSAG